MFPLSPIPAANVASVPLRSPLRYPGGKTWLVPHVREWLTITTPHILIEPFAGGGIVSLTAVMEGLVDRAVMVELDRDVAAFWHAALNHGTELCDRINRFEPTLETVKQVAADKPADVVSHGFRTLVLNRTRRGGILASGASFSRRGENGKGVASRWYPTTLVKRLKNIGQHADRIVFCEADSMQLLDPLLHGWDHDAAVFVDPPYTASGGKQAGSRLYTHSQIDHSRLFALLAQHQVNFLMTYDQTPQIVDLIDQHSFTAVTVEMKTAHHKYRSELAITSEPMFS